MRSGRALEKLAEVDAIVFDKTGILTRKDVVVVVKSFGETPPRVDFGFGSSGRGETGFLARTSVKAGDI